MKFPDFEKGYFGPRRIDRVIVNSLSQLATSDFVQQEQRSRMTKEQVWRVYDSPLEYDPADPLMYPVSYDFGPFASVGTSFKQHIQQIVPAGGVGVEIGGPGSRLFGGFDEGTFRVTYGLTLEDLRGDEQKARDAARGHILIPGDFRITMDELRDRLDGTKVNVLFSRMCGGNTLLPYDPYFWAEQLDAGYQLMSEEGGTIYTSAPKITEPLVYPWVRRLHEDFEETIGVDVYIGPVEAQLEIEKLPGAPEHIPLLSAREVRRHYERAFADDEKYVDPKVLLARKNRGPTPIRMSFNLAYLDEEEPNHPASEPMRDANLVETSTDDVIITGGDEGRGVVYPTASNYPTESLNREMPSKEEHER